MKAIIAEDDYRVAMIHKEYLNSYREVVVVGHALKGTELLSQLQKQPDIDLLLLDLYFPDISRLELLQKVRANHPKLDIIIVSASDDASMLQQAKRQGVYAFLKKPVDVRLFRETISDYLKERAFLSEPGQTFSNSDAKRVLGGGKYSQAKSVDNLLPSGIDAITLDRVYTALKGEQNGLTIEETCEAVGVSRTTARRYLEHLVREQHIRTHLNYGVIGRPERRYMLKRP
ncbi:response regulator [Shouchella clausii]|uniref:Response regulatory domain-containing protein n=1 Tax=Shouchella clausii TaxID=79880 RepID=A0A268S3S2_SHOCL|nr:response regulator [Shouchella clausii]MCM3549612.1 response regulator [Shouchella clausii]MED4159809.1 response regulator [Shouchella clausii]MED4177861.1 response regulator [Shouchella clausii]PAD13317.1 hypothetical protein CHH74_12155 [Shouchella clausii]PAF13523.1 hypothetical protein CHH59_12850 [Shouchella clausii]